VVYVIYPNPNPEYISTACHLLLTHVKALKMSTFKLPYHVPARKAFKMKTITSVGRDRHRRK
jgi:hypothetical protein